MESLMVKYASELELIKDEPYYNRIRAIKRFFMLMNFESNFLPTWLEAGASKTKAVKEYCKKISLSEGNFYRFYRKYKNGGIRGLLPKFGSLKRRHKSKIRGHVLLERQEKLIIPMVINFRDPLSCLKTLKKIIKESKYIQPKTKSAALLLLNHYFIGQRCSNRLTLPTKLTDEEVQVLQHYKAGSNKTYRSKATVILMANDGYSLLETIEATHACETSIYRWLQNFKRDRLNSIETTIHAPTREREMEDRKTRVIDIIHKMPSLFGINRTTWTYGAIAEAYSKEYNTPMTAGKVQYTVHGINYSWRRARRVLTSPDPEYKEKVDKLLDTLQGLKEGERFFFIDEVGPYRVKKYGGRILMPKDQAPEIPEYQKNKGKIQFVAALEAVTNQMIWLFTPDKGALSMVTLLDKIIQQYSECPAVYFTWDAISVHNSKTVTDWIETHNLLAVGPHIEVVPLPSNAQFLNVIESVFGGMKKAVICNSDYESPKEMQEAISRHFEERNAFFKANPKRAGNKIWDKQKFDFDKLAGGLFKQM